MNKMPKKIRPMMISYFELLDQRKLAATDRALNDIKQNVNSTQWQRGYVNALEGMLVALKSNYEECIVIHKINSRIARQTRKEFIKESRNELQAEFDKGFFSAWTDYIQFLEKKLSLNE